MLQGEESVFYNSVAFGADNITVQDHTFRRMKEQLDFLMVKNKKEKSTQNWQGSEDGSGGRRRGNKYEQNTLHESLKEWKKWEDKPQIKYIVYTHKMIAQ